MEGNPLKSSYNPVLLTNTPVDASIRILDPNPVGEIVPQEDLFIYVSLVARQKNKSVLTVTDDGSGAVNPQRVVSTLDLTVPQQKTTINGNDLFQTKSHLTTDWSEMGGFKNISLGTDYETFGITNIDIEIKSAVTPKVVIDFVDVRGTTLFEQGSCSPYGLFFNLPYPIFELTVKGYYGRPVKYYLNLVKFNTKFNSDTGNMECRGEFIGYSFAFLSDTIVSYVSAAQYLPPSYNAKSILKEKYENTWSFYTTGGNRIMEPDGTSTGPYCNNNVVKDRCTTILDLIRSIKNLSQNDLPDFKGSTEWSELENLLSLQSYMKIYEDSIYDAFKKLSAGNDTQPSAKQNFNSKVVFKSKPCPKDSTVSTNGCDIEATKILIEFFDKTKGKFASDISFIKTQKIKDNTYASDYDVKVLSSAVKTDFENNNAADKIYDLIESDWQSNILDTYGYKGKTDTGIIGYIDFGYLIENLNTEITKIDDEVKNKKQVLIDDLNRIVESRVGFKPSIRNIFTVLLCNTDAFMEILLQIAIKAEQYHDNQTYKEVEVGSSTRISANTKGQKPKVYAWPTVFERDKKPKKGTGKSQGTKEIFPGNNPKFLNWVEVRFVEDFITAYLDYVKEVELINDLKEGKVGFDNYAPVSVLEAPITYSDNPMIYKDIEPDQDTIFKTIGERLFISMDHTNFQPSRLTYAGSGNGTGLPIDNDNILLTKDGKKIGEQLGAIDSWNLLNAQEGTSGIKLIEAIKRYANDANDFIQKIKDTLKNNGTLTELSDVIKYSPKNGYIQLTSSEARDEVKIYADPTKMVDKPDNLIKILEAQDASQFKITITNEDFKTILNTYQQTITDIFPTTLNEDAADFKITNSSKLDDNNKIPSFEDKRFFILSNITDNAKNGTKPSSWWTSGDVSTIKPSWLTYFTVIDTTGDNEAQGINIKFNAKYVLSGSSDSVLSGPTTDTDVGSWLKNAFGSDKGYVDSFVTTPSWVDNVNKFRNLVNPGSNLTPAPNLDTEETQYANLAYLFLHLLKPTPLIVRGVNENYELKYDINKGVKEPDYPAEFFSIKNFNISGGVVKAPKAWVLALGAQLWRWKSFVGVRTVNGKEVWNKPLDANQPTGFDPLAQPSYNSIWTDGYDKGVDRIKYEDYLTLVYGSNPGWSNRVQKSVFYNNFRNSDLGSFDDEDKFGFDYYGVYRNRINLSINYSDWDGKNPNHTAKLAAQWYSWPTLWIAPHHIPYTHPTVFYDGSQFIGAPEQYIVINPYQWAGELDYQTIMPQQIRPNNTSTVYGYNEYGSNKNTQRGRKQDGDLGYVIQYLPDEIKNKFVDYFLEWTKGDWKEIIKVIDPANFSNTPINFDTYYKLVSTKDDEALADGAGGAWVMDPNNTSTQDVVKKLLAPNNDVYIVNSTPKIWYGLKTFEDSFVCSTSVFNDYLTSFYNNFNTNSTKKITEINDNGTKNEFSLANSSLEDDDIKLSLYRTFKSLTDKWISASNKGKLFFNILSEGGGEKCGGANAGDKGSLAAHFQYVNRIMGDIGNDAVLDITKLNQLKDNPKITLYQYISDLLTENEYMFFPLPAYINYAQKGISKEDLEDMFRPVMNFDKVSCGPLFLCMYVGGNSRQLNFRPKTECQYDAIDVNFDDDGFNISSFSGEKPEEFSPSTQGDDRPGFTAFRVVYGLENQNHFKNIQLDQSEFSETAESLLVIDKLSQQGGTDQTTKGQNLNSVYLTRSYTCSLESLGNLMIQPMMYFDLFGVPMFNGAYLITEVKHNFKPNNASTSFKGVRQPIATVPIVTDAAVAMNLSLKNVEASKNGGSSSDIAQTTTTASGPNTNTGGGSASVAGGGTGVISGAGANPLGIDLARHNPPISPDIKKLFGNPVLCSYKPHISSGFLRNKSMGFKLHGGVDIIPTQNGGDLVPGKSYPIISAYDGIVNYVGTVSGFGKPPNGGAVIIRYGENGGLKPFSDGYWIFYIYGHSVAKSGLQKGSSVKKGEIIGKAVFPNWVNKPGDTANGGLHLHLTVQRQPADRPEMVWTQRDSNYRIIPTILFNQQEDCISGIVDYFDSGGAGDSPLAGNNSLVEGDKLSKKQIFDYLNSKLNNANLVYGIMGNLQSESNFRSDAAGDGRKTGKKQGLGPLTKDNVKYYCSWGYSQLNVCGGGGSGFLKDLGLENASDSEKIKALTNPKKHLDYIIKQAGKLYGGLPVTQTDSIQNWAKRFAKDYERCQGCSNPSSLTVAQRSNNATKISNSGLA